jgi:uncharacterized membrane protein YdbT with pleckstrin-like domain
MSIEQAKTKVVASIWQSIAQSGVQVSALPQDQLNTLVNAIADGVLVAVDDMMDQAGLPQRQAAAAASPLSSEEQTLWEGRPFLSLVTQYKATTERLRIITGILGKDREDIELIRIQDLDLEQGLGERALNIGDIHVRSADPSDPDVVLRNVKHPTEVHEILRRAMLDARKRFRYSVQEEM